MDQDLIGRVQEGDQRAFRELLIADHPRLFRVAYGILRDRRSAERATRKALLDAWHDMRRLREPAGYEGWTIRLLVRACGREAERRPDWLRGGLAAPVRQPRSGDEQRSVLDHAQLERGFLCLSVDHRAVVVLHHLLDLAPDEVAETLGIPRRIVSSRLQQAMPTLRAALDADAWPPSPSHARDGALP